MKDKDDFSTFELIIGLPIVFVQYIYALIKLVLKGESDEGDRNYLKNEKGE